MSEKKERREEKRYHEELIKEVEKENIKEFEINEDEDKEWGNY